MGPPRKRRLVAIDELSWKAVALPERMDDAEGFYGLEEIDDVEVVRDGSRISFRAAKSPAVSDVARSDETESEWEDIDDDDDADQDRARPSTPAMAETAESVDAKSGNAISGKDAKKKTKKKTEKLERQKKQKASGEDRPLAAANGFHHLEGKESDDVGADVSAWSGVGLSADMTMALSAMGFSKPTPIQEASLPHALDGRDVIGKASTGSGKTLAYGIPIFEGFLSKQPKQADGEQKWPTALALAPTRELAHQISKHLGELTMKLPSTGPRIATITGGLSVQKQQRLLKDADIVIGTPGRLWEVINSESGLLSALRRIDFLVIDEADRLLSEGHFKELEEILKSLDRTDVDGENLEGELEKPKRQTLVFSATFQKGLQRKLAGKGRHQDSSMMTNRESMEYLLEKLNFREDTPKYIDVNPVSQMANNLREGLIECGATEKDLYLYALLMHFPKARSLIFCNSINAVRRITPFLQNLGLKAQGLHSQMPQKARLRAIERFSSQDGSILVATDVAARGLDIPQVQLVAHYHVPRQADVYVHRSGRTARAESAGSSVMLCAPDEAVPVRRLVAKVHAKKAAQGSKSGGAGTRFFIRTLDMDRQVVGRLKERAELAKRIADVELAKEKHRAEDSWLKKAAEDLGVDYEPDEFEAAEGSGKKKGKKRGEREAEARAVSKKDVGRLKAQLKDLLARRINVGVSERYLTSGGIDVDQLIRERNQDAGGIWLGRVDSLGFDA